MGIFYNIKNFYFLCSNEKKVLFLKKIKKIFEWFWIIYSVKMGIFEHKKQTHGGVLKYFKKNSEKKKNFFKKVLTSIILLW